jgi:hypothetical protein
LCAFALLSLGACVTPLVDEAMQQSLVVRSIKVDASGIKPIGGGRETQIETDLKAALTAQMIKPGQGKGNADVLVTVTEIFLVSRGQSFALGGNSHMTGTLTVTEAGSGKVILAPTVVGGGNANLRLGGVLGALTAPMPDKDYADTLTGFAKQNTARLLGKQTAPE